jgi:hypothetical protein
MNRPSNLVKEILSLYNTILENKEMVEVTDIYDNVDFKDKVVGASTPSKDTINTSLLQDIQTAAKSAGVKVDITTAVSGHKTGTRHQSGNAIDIAVIDGKSVRPSNRTGADKLVNALVQMGYVKNKEDSSIPKSVLTFGFPGHDTHVHVSNTGGASSVTPSSGSETAYAAATKGGSGESMSAFGSKNHIPAETDNLLYQSGLEIGRKIKPESKNESRQIKEQKSFGKNISNRYGKVIIPKDTNPKIKSPISGEIVDKYASGCVNPVTIKNTDKKPIYLQFCGISSPSVRSGQSISNGETLGGTDTDVEVTMYNSSWNRIGITDNSFDNRQSKDVDTDTTKKRGKNSGKRDRNLGKTYADPLTAIIASLPGKAIDKVFGDKYDKSGNRTEKRWGGVSDKKQVDPWLLNMIKKPFKKKVTENIERIKKLL